MSTTLLDERGLYVQQFWGGKERRMCLEVGTPEGGSYIQVTEEELRTLIPVFTRWLVKMEEDRKKEAIRLDISRQLDDVHIQCECGQGYLLHLTDSGWTIEKKVKE